MKRSNKEVLAKTVGELMTTISRMENKIYTGEQDNEEAILFLSEAYKWVVKYWEAHK